jgi:hypothetical protein
MGINSVMDHGGPDPIQGFDVDVWVQDPTRYTAGTGGAAPSPGAAGGLILLGSFTSIVVTVRNATEAYMELNQRMPRYLDGEVQIAWVMEKGLLDIWSFKQTFGFSMMRRNQRFNRSPRFVITFQSNTAGELNSSVNTSNTNYMTNMIRQPDGRFVLYMCKVDSWHFAATAGKQVVASQWQGVSEGLGTIGSVYNMDGVDGANTDTSGENFSRVAL